MTNTTFNNISVISCGRVVDDIGVPGENHQPWQIGGNGYIVVYPPNYVGISKRSNHFQRVH